MLLFLVRHGETVDNCAGVNAGSTDSALTNHGVLQANRLGQYLAQKVTISHIFSSDLQRAFKTAEAIRLAQTSPPAETVQVVALREKDFGSFEGTKYGGTSRDDRRANKSGKDTRRNAADFKDVESKEAMTARTDRYVAEHLMPLFDLADAKSVVIVAHGLILNHLWPSILRRFPPNRLSFGPGVVAGDQVSGRSFWSNTGYLEVEIRENTAPLPQPEVTSQDLVHEVAATDNAAVEEKYNPKASGIDLLNKTVVVKAINSLEHLKGLKKTRGGIGSTKHDSGQKTIDSMFKKRKVG